MEKKNIWTPFKIWNETQWFTNINSLIDKFKSDRKKKLINQFWNRKEKFKEYKNNYEKYKSKNCKLK